MKVKVIYRRQTVHPRYGLLKPGKVLEIDDDFPIRKSNLFRKIKPKKKEK